MDDTQEKKFKHYQALVFSFTFVNYALAHWTRKSYTNVKVEMMEAGVTVFILGAMDSAFMTFYACGSLITGPLGDRFSPVTVIGVGLLGSSACLVAMIFGTYPFVSSNAYYCTGWFVVTQCFHGLFQATGGPVNTAIMGNWFGKEGRGLVFGFWTCHQYVGDLVAAMAGYAILSSSMSWEYAIWIPLIVNAAWAFANFTVIPNCPADVGIITEDAQKRIEKGDDMSKPLPPIPISKAFMIPNVLSYAVAFGFFKLINYAMFFQLPFILSSVFSPSKANLISALYSVGMMPGGVVCGVVSDLYGGRRACVCATMMLLLVPLLCYFAYFMDTMNVYAILGLLVLMGCLVGGPNNIITSAVAADLSDDPSIKGNNRALGTVTGIINGCGSITAAIGQMAIPGLLQWGVSDGVHYRYVWLFLVCCAFMGTALLTPKIYKELRPAPKEEEITPLRASMYRSSSYHSLTELNEGHTM